MAWKLSPGGDPFDQAARVFGEMLDFLPIANSFVHQLCGHRAINSTTDSANNTSLRAANLPNSINFFRNEGLLLNGNRVKPRQTVRM